MNLNLTLVGQMITFAVFVIFTMKYVWPPITKALRERQNRIAEGLAASDRSKHELELAQHKSAEILREAKVQAATYIEEANKRSLHIIEESKEQARKEGERIISHAHGQIEIDRNNAKESLRHEIAELALLGASKIIGREVDAASNDSMIDQLIAEVSSE